MERDPDAVRREHLDDEKSDVGPETDAQGKLLAPCALGELDVLGSPLVLVLLHGTPVSVQEVLDLLEILDELVLLAVVLHDAVLAPGVEVAGEAAVQTRDLRLGLLLRLERLAVEPPRLAEDPAPVVVLNLPRGGAASSVGEHHGGLLLPLDGHGAQISPTHLDRATDVLSSSPSATTTARGAREGGSAGPEVFGRQLLDLLDGDGAGARGDFLRQSQPTNGWREPLM